MKLYHDYNNLEAGIDEVARGCLLGRVYTAAVIWNKENDPDFDHPVMKDSKKLSKQNRQIMSDYIKDLALDYNISFQDEKTIDNINILNATYKSMHQSLDGLNIEVDNILVDGNKFKPYITKKGKLITHQCIIDGDTKFYPIACASILAKVAHDDYIVELCKENPDLNEKYDLLSNMGYGTKRHIEGIQKYGLSNFHRKSFGICKNYQ
tara:strand:- start:121 stop:744 length:624 start_codon:yes stop_codon:yes gene_type:complete